jgi:hypothetical protein
LYACSYSELCISIIVPLFAQKETLGTFWKFVEIIGGLQKEKSGTFWKFVEIMGFHLI